MSQAENPLVFVANCSNQDRVGSCHWVTLPQQTQLETGLQVEADCDKILTNQKASVVLEVPQDGYPYCVCLEHHCPQYSTPAIKVPRRK